MFKFYNVIKRLVDEIFCTKFYGIYLRTIVYMYSKVVAKLLLNHTGFFFYQNWEKQCSAILLIALLMDKAFVKTSLLGI